MGVGCYDSVMRCDVKRLCEVPRVTTYLLIVGCQSVNEFLGHEFGPKDYDLEIKILLLEEKTRRRVSFPSPSFVVRLTLSAPSAILLLRNNCWRSVRCIVSYRIVS